MKLTQTHRLVKQRDGAKDFRRLHNRHKIITRRNIGNFREKSDHRQQRQQEALLVLDRLADHQALFGDLFKNPRRRQVAVKRKEREEKKSIKQVKNRNPNK